MKDPVTKRKKQVAYAKYNHDDSGAFHLDTHESKEQQQSRGFSWDIQCALQDLQAEAAELANEAGLTGGVPQAQAPLLSMEQVEVMLEQGRAEKKQKRQSAQNATAAAAVAGLGERMNAVKAYISLTWAGNLVERDRLGDRLSDLKETEAGQAREFAAHRGCFTDAKVILSFKAFPRVWSKLSKKCVRNALLVMEQEEAAQDQLNRTRADILDVESCCNELDCKRRDVSSDVRICMHPINKD